MTTSKIFSKEELLILNSGQIPRHVALIPDGNRRWAQKLSEGSQKGHQAGAGVLIDIVKAAKEIGIQTITFYLFSTENWNRSPEEISALMWLLQNFLRDQTEVMQKNGVKLEAIGAYETLPEEVLKTIEETRKATANCNQINMILALNYGSRDELRRAFHRILDEYELKKLSKDEITESMIASYLDTAQWGDPDLLIRTSGEMRLSNFLLWQLSYSEIFVTDVLWPDYKPIDLLNAIVAFQKRNRRLGGK